MFSYKCASNCSCCVKPEAVPFTYKSRLDNQIIKIRNERCSDRFFSCKKCTVLRIKAYFSSDVNVPIGGYVWEVYPACPVKGDCISYCYYWDNAADGGKYGDLIYDIHDPFSGNLTYELASDTCSIILAYYKYTINDQGDTVCQITQPTGVFPNSVSMPISQIEMLIKCC